MVLLEHVPFPQGYEGVFGLIQHEVEAGVEPVLILVLGDYGERGLVLSLDYGLSQLLLLVLHALWLII